MKEILRDEEDLEIMSEDDEEEQHVIGSDLTKSFSKDEYIAQLEARLERIERASGRKRGI